MAIDAQLFRWKMTHRKYQNLLKAHEEWVAWVQGEVPDAARAAGLDITAHWLDTLGHADLAKLVRTERDQLVDRVMGPLQVRLRKPRTPRKEKADPDEPDTRLHLRAV